jgi:hypothetical protein
MKHENKIELLLKVCFFLLSKFNVFNMIVPDRSAGGIDKEKLSKALAKYRELSSFVNGSTSVRKDGKVGFIDQTDKEVTLCIYDKVFSFYGGLALVSILLFFLCCNFMTAQNSRVMVAAHRGDGHSVVMHDRTVDRTTNDKSHVSDFTLEEIHQLRLRNNLERITDSGISTLEETMLIAKGRILVNIDKGDTYVRNRVTFSTLPPPPPRTIMR